MGQPLVWCGPSRSISFFSQRWKVSSCGWQMNGWTGGVDTVLFGTMKLEKGPTRWISESAHVPLQGYNGRATAIWQTPWESPCVSLGAETQGKFRRTASAKIRNRFSEFQNVKENRRFWFFILVCLSLFLMDFSFYSRDAVSHRAAQLLNSWRWSLDVHAMKHEEWKAADAQQNASGRFQLGLGDGQQEFGKPRKPRRKSIELSGHQHGLLDNPSVDDFH